MTTSLTTRCIAISTALVVFHLSTQIAWAGKPNVVLFLADDLGWNDCSINNPKCGIRTPNMERVAAAGMTLSHAFVASPSCAPSRAALLTGLSPVRNGAMFNHTVPDKSHKRWPVWFQERGYEVVAIGKVAHYATVQQYGFDHVSHFNYHQDDCIDAALAWLEKRRTEPALGSSDGSKANGLEDRGAKAPKPLCLLVGTNWPHVPWPEKTEYRDDQVPLPPTHVDTTETRQWRARYAAAVSLADRDLGRIFDAAFERLGPDTLFLFTSDHGAQWPFGKWNCYDAGLRTPLVAVWPEKIQPGSRSDALVSWIDILPTCLDAIERGMSADAARNTDASDQGRNQRGAPNRAVLGGRSFLPVLLGQATSHHDHIFATHSGDGAMNDYAMRAVRSRRWKYIRNLAPDSRFTTHIDKAKPVDGRSYWLSWQEQAKVDPLAAKIVQRYHVRPAEELYDLEHDPHEQINLAADPERSQQLIELRLTLDAWMKLEGDRGLDTENARRPTPKAR